MKEVYKMYKSKVRKITITFIIFLICLLFNNFNLANVFNNKEAKDLKVEISAFTNDFENTQMLKFEVEDNPNVVKGKMAPGSKAHANMKINLDFLNGFHFQSDGQMILAIVIIIAASILIFLLLRLREFVILFSSIKIILKALSARSDTNNQ